MSKVFNRNKVNFLKNPIFFGEELNTQRYDDFKYPIFDKLTQRQLGYFWRPEEVSLQKDRNDYNELSKAHKHIFTSNLKYQTLLDSVQGRGPATALLPFCTLPELEGCIIAWDFMETIHSRSYTYMIKNLYSDPTKIFDTILDDEKIIARAESVTKRYDEFIDYAQRYSLGYEKDEYELKKRLYLALISINILEGIRFFVSFACTFAFGEMKKMEGSAKIISLIARDEAQHLAISQHILKCYQKEEKDWAEYLFMHGSMLGLSTTLLSQYVEYIANRRLRAIGLKPIYDVSSRTNPLPWTQHWLTSKGQQNAPQETEIESYVIGGIKQDIKEDTFEGFKL